MPWSKISSRNFEQNSNFNPVCRYLDSVALFAKSSTILSSLGTRTKDRLHLSRQQIGTFRKFQAFSIRLEMRDPYLHFYQVLCLPLWRTYILLLLRCRKMFSQFSCPTSRPRKLRFEVTTTESPFRDPLSNLADFSGWQNFLLAFQLNIRFFIAPFPAFNTLMTVLIHISGNFTFVALSLDD